jgi:predicted nucleic acid-binding protein
VARVAASSVASVPKTNRRTILIAALAVECGALLWSLDAEFARMERLRLIERYDP